MTLSDLETLLRSIVWRQSTADTPEFHDALAGLRRQIDQIDAESFELLSNRMRVPAVTRQKQPNVAVLVVAVVEQYPDKADGPGSTARFECGIPAKTIMEMDPPPRASTCMNKIANE